jgi:hypothetical protein
MSVCVQNQVLLLPENYRTIIWLFGVLGFTLKETADILELSIERPMAGLRQSRRLPLLNICSIGSMSRLSFHLVEKSPVQRSTL